jgi:hypothetical protein
MAGNYFHNRLGIWLATLCTVALEEGLATLFTVALEEGLATLFTVLPPVKH